MEISPLLNRVHSREEVPLNSYVFYSLDGGIYWTSQKNFADFALQWVGMMNRPPLTMDLSYACIHSVILDLDFTLPSSGENSQRIFPIIESILKMTLLPSVPNFTYITATRSQHQGVHVHLPEIKIAHDDYILFCQFLQFKFRQALQPHQEYKLDILTNAMLPGASKPGKSPYVPYQMTYVDEKNTFQLNFFEPDRSWKDLKKSFAKRKDNEKSIFRNLLNANSGLFMSEMCQLMMPVVVRPLHAHTLTYATSIGKTPNVSPDSQDVALFTYKKTGEYGYVRKSKKIFFNNASHVLKIYHHLKLNSGNVLNFETNNHALKMWFQLLCKSTTQTEFSDHFRDVHEALAFEHATLANNPNPLKTVMQFGNGYYFLPVFYALCRHYRTDSRRMAEQLLGLLDEPFHALLNKVRTINPDNVQHIISEISLNTLHFCASNLHAEQPKKNRDKLKLIIENNRRAILSVTTLDQMVELVRSIQQKHLPILVLRLKNALKKPSRFIWNSLIESWQEVNMSGEVTDHLFNLWNHVKQFLNEYRESGGLGGPDNEIVEGFSVASVVSSIMSDTTMERKDIQMDTHKWLIRLEDGILDLLTGHVGGVVPEFFLSDRKVRLGVPRERFSKLCNDSPDLVRLYELLVDKSFFLKYLKALFTNRGETLFDVLCGMVEETQQKDVEVAYSMMYFYVNLCKCTSFEYDVMIYMLDILGSIFIATNYERKFFVWKGLTRNGKSKLFELLGRVFGGYYHCIQSENLTPHHSVNNATPELASTLFSCRIVTSEELEGKLNENRVKQITGNSFVTFRNMYEQNSGGIPTAKIFATTNNYPECKASEAFKDRVVAIPFDAEFSDDAPLKTSEQVGQNLYTKEAYVVEQSYLGCFFMLYYHLQKHMSVEDALLHYRKEPEYVQEFTHDYLIHADIYEQFKIHMDVQCASGCTTTMNDVKSAVRQFLKSTKNTSYHETALIVPFEKEFGHLRRTDIEVDSCVPYTSILDEEDEETPAKKAKTGGGTFVFYENVVIKNLRRTNLEF